jgi:hypothetical protein
MFIYILFFGYGKAALISLQRYGTAGRKTRDKCKRGLVLAVVCRAVH